MIIILKMQIFMSPGQHGSFGSHNCCLRRRRRMRRPDWELLLLEDTGGSEQTKNIVERVVHKCL